MEDIARGIYSDKDIMADVPMMPQLTLYDHYLAINLRGVLESVQ